MLCDPWHRLNINSNNGGIIINIRVIATISSLYIANLLVNTYLKFQVALQDKQSCVYIRCSTISRDYISRRWQFSPVFHSADSSLIFRHGRGGTFSP